MSKIDRGRKITLSFKEKGANGKATLVIDLSSDESDLPHEHRDDMKEIASELLGVPVETLEGIDVEMKRKGHDHPHPHPDLTPGENTEPEKAKA